MTCNRITQLQQPFMGITSGCTQVKPQFNNTSIFNYSSYNRQTNINQTFINKDNAGVSINNNITVNNYNQFGSKVGIQPGFSQKVGQFFNGYKKQPQIGCACKQQNKFIGWGQFSRSYIYQPVQRFCSNITNKLRNFMNFRYSNVNA